MKFARVLTIAVIAALAASGAVSAKEFRLEESKNFSVQDGFNLSVENISGDIEVVKGAGAEVVVRITRFIDADSRREAEERGELIEVDIDAGSSSIDIKTRYPKHRGGDGLLDWIFGYRNGWVAYVIEVPGTVDLRASSASGNVIVEEIQGFVEVSTTSGDVLIRDFTGNCDLNATSGNIEITNLTGNLELSSTSSELRLDNIKGEVNVQSTSGDVEARYIAGAFTLANTSGGVRLLECSGDIDLRSVSGDIEIGQRSGSLFVATTSGDVKVESAFSGRTFGVETVSGNIEVRVPAEVKGNLRLATVSGTIDTDLALSVRSFDRRRLTGQIGGGGNIDIELTSSSGDIIVAEY